MRRRSFRSSRSQSSRTSISQPAVSTVTSVSGRLLLTLIRSSQSRMSTRTRMQATFKTPTGSRARTITRQQQNPERTSLKSLKRPRKKRRKATSKESQNPSRRSHSPKSQSRRTRKTGSPQSTTGCSRSSGATRSSRHRPPCSASQTTRRAS